MIVNHSLPELESSHFDRAESNHTVHSDTCNTTMQVPLLNASSISSLAHHSLVRYRCMVQDQFDPEFYFQVYHIRSSASSRSDQGEAVRGAHNRNHLLFAFIVSVFVPRWLAVACIEISTIIQ